VSVYLIAASRREARALRELFPGPPVYVGQLPAPDVPFQATDQDIKDRLNLEVLSLDGTGQAAVDLFSDLVIELPAARRPDRLPNP
jgi:hypothetical protein